MIRQFVYKTVTRAISRTIGTPAYLILFVSDSCWMKCQHCWFNEDWKDNHLTQERLSFEELSKMADSIDRLGFLSLTGGEAFMRQDIVEIVKMFATKTKLYRYQIPTSGFKPDLIVSKAEKMLIQNPGIPFRVDVSMDGLQEVHDEIRVISGGYDRVQETVRKLRELKKKYNYFDVGIITTVSKTNQHQMKKISDVARTANPDGEWMVNITRGEVRNQAARDVNPDNYFAAHRLIEERIEEGSYSGHGGHATAKWLTAKNAVRRTIIKRILDGKFRGGGCAAGTIGGVIYSDGSVMPCEMLDKSYGNVRDFNYDLRSLWNSQVADETRNWIQDTECQCTQECFISISVLIQPEWWPSLIRERLRLTKFVKPKLDDPLKVSRE